MPNRIQKPSDRLSGRKQFSLSAYWLGTNLHWMALLMVIMPHQVELIEPANKAYALSCILGIGAFIALVMPPFIGVLSDRCMARWGRRRPYILAGTLINLAGLVLLFYAGKTLSYWLYLIGYVVVQFGNNTATASYTGIIPDIVPKNQRGAASGWMAAMTQIGNILGAFLAGILVQHNQMALAYFLISAVLGACMLITLLGTREIPLTTSPPPASLKQVLASMWIDPRKHPDFGWVWLTRFLFTFGMWMVQPFLMYYLRDIVHVQDADGQTGYVLGVALIGATFTGILGGSVSDRIGRKKVVYIANGAMAFTSLGFLFAHTLGAIYCVAVVYGLAFGAYYSVDWALGCDVLPNRESDAAKDMGVWHISMVLPQSLAPFLSGMLLTAFGASVSKSLKEPAYNMAGYTAIFILAAVFLALSALGLRNVKGVK